MSKEVQNRVTYMIYCVSAFANHHGLNFKQAYSYLKRFKADLSIICNRNGGALI